MARRAESGVAGPHELALQLLLERVPVRLLRAVSAAAGQPAELRRGAGGDDRAAAGPQELSPCAALHPAFLSAGSVSPMRSRPARARPSTPACRPPCRS